MHVSTAAHHSQFNIFRTVQTVQQSESYARLRFWKTSAQNTIFDCKSR